MEVYPDIYVLMPGSQSFHRLIPRGFPVCLAPVHSDTGYRFHLSFEQKQPDLLLSRKNGANNESYEALILPHFKKRLTDLAEIRSAIPCFFISVTKSGRLQWLTS